MNCLHKHGFNGDPKLQYRMFKSGKAWVFATTAMFALVAGTNTLVRADQVTTPSAVTAKLPATHTNPPIQSAEQRQSATSHAGQSNQTISSDSTTLNNNGHTNSENKTVKAAKSPAEKSTNSVTARSAATDQQQAVKQSALTVRTAQPASSTAQATTTKATYQAAVSQAHHFAQTATSQAQVVDQYAQVAHDQVTKTKIQQAKQYANEAQTAANLTAQYASLAAVNMAVMANSTATTSYDAAIDQMTLALNATSSYTAQALSAAAAAEQAAVTAIRQTANHTYLQFGQVADVASSTASQVNSLTNQARLVAQTDPDSQAIDASVKQINQLATTTDQLKGQLKQAWRAAQTANQALQQSDFATVQAALTTLQAQAITASQAEQQLQQATSQANGTLQALTNASKSYAGSHANQVAKQASQAVTAIQQQLSQAQSYHGDQAKQYASAVSVSLEVARSQAQIAELKAAAVQASQDLQTILSQSQQAVAAAAIATEQLKTAQQATKLAQQFDTDVKNEQTDHEGAHILLQLSKDQANINLNQSITPDIQVTDLGSTFLVGSMTIHGDLTYTWYQSTDGETWRVMLSTKQRAPIKLSAAGKYYLQVVVAGYKWNLVNNYKFKAASNVVAVVVNDQDGGDYQQQAEQALASAATTNSQYVKIKQASTQAYQQAQQLLDMNQQADIQAAYHELTQQLDQATQTYQNLQAKKVETAKLMAANNYAQAKLAAQATEKLALNLKTQVATAMTTWQQVQAKLETALTAAAKQQSTAQVQHYLASSYAAMAAQAAQAASQAATSAGYANANMQGLAEHTQSFDSALTSTAQTVSAEAQQASSVAKMVAQAASLASQAATTDDYQLAASQMTVASSAAAQLAQDLATLNPIIQQAVTELASKQSKHYQALITTNAHLAGDAEDAMLKAGTSIHKLPSNNTTLGSSYAALTQSAADQTSQAFKIFNQATITMNNQIGKVTSALKQGQYSAAIAALSAAATMATTMESLANKTQQVSANGQKTEKLAIDYSNAMSPVFDGRGDAGYAFGIVMVSGITSQPTALTSTRSGNTIHLSASSRLGLGVPGITSTGSWQVQVHNQWLSLADASQYFTFHENKRDGNFLAGTVFLNVSNSSSLDVTLASDFVGSLIFQWKTDYGVIGLNPITTASDLAEVDVYDKDIPATGLTIAGADYVVYSKAQAQQTKDIVLVESQYTTQTIPGNATGEIQWQSNHPEIADIDDGGMLTVYGPGTVDLTATITNADGTVYQAVKQVVVGNGLSDQTAAAGSTLAWQPDGLENVPSDQVTYQWYVAQDLTSDGQAIKGATQATLTLAQLKLSQAGYYYLVVTGKNTNAASQKGEAASATLITLGRAKLTVIGTATASANAAAEQMQLIIDNAKHYQIVTNDYVEFTTTYAKQHPGAANYVDQAHQAQADLAQHKATLSTLNQQVVAYQQQAAAAENAGNNAEAASLAANAQDYVAQALTTQTNISQATSQARSAAESALKVVDPVIPPTENPGSQGTNKPTPTIPDTGANTGTATDDGHGDNGQTPSTGDHTTEKPGTSNPDAGNGSTNGDGTGDQSNGGPATETPTPVIPGNTDSGNDNGQSSGGTTAPGTTDPSDGANSGSDDGGHPSTGNPTGTPGTPNAGDGTNPDIGAGHDNSDNQPGTHSENKPGTLAPDGDQTPNTSDNHTNNGGNTTEIPGKPSSGDHSTEVPTPGNTGNHSSNTADGHNNGDKPETGSTPGTSGTANAGDGTNPDTDADHNNGTDQSNSGTPAKPEIPNTGAPSTETPTPVIPGHPDTGSDNGQSSGSETTGHGAANSGDGTTTGSGHDNSGNESGTHTINKPGPTQPGDGNTPNTNDGNKPSTGSTTETPAPIVPTPGDGDNQSNGSTTEIPGSSTSNGDNHQSGADRPGPTQPSDGNTPNTDDGNQPSTGSTTETPAPIVPTPGDGNNQSNGSTTEIPGPSTPNGDNNQSGTDKPGTSRPGDGNTPNTDESHNNGNQSGNTTKPDDGHDNGSNQSTGGAPAKPEIPTPGDHSTTEPDGTHSGNGTTSTPGDSHNNQQSNNGTTGDHAHNGTQSGTHVIDKPENPDTSNAGDGTHPDITGDQGGQTGGNTTGATTEKPVGPTGDGQQPSVPGTKPGLTPAPNPSQPVDPNHNDGHQSETGANQGNGQPAHPDVNQPNLNGNSGNTNQAGKPNKPDGTHSESNTSGNQHVTPKPGDDAHAGSTSHGTKPGNSGTPSPQPLPMPGQNAGTTTDSGQPSQQVKPEKPMLNGGNQTTVANVGGQGAHQPKPLPNSSHGQLANSATLQPTTNVQGNHNWVKPIATDQSKHQANVPVIESLAANKPIQQYVKWPGITGDQAELAKLMGAHGQSATMLVTEQHTPTARFNLASAHSLATEKHSKVASLPEVKPKMARDSADSQSKAADSKSAHVANQVNTSNMQAGEKPAATGMAADHLQAQHRQAKSVWPRLSTWLVIFLVLGISAWWTLIKTRRPKSIK